MKIVIRVDASIEIGIGHVMRCLTLADALKEINAQIEFICFNHKGNLIDFIQSKGFKVHLIDSSNTNLKNYDYENNKSNNEISYTSWLGQSQEHDATLCKKIVQNIMPDWIIIDHYAIDNIWHKKMRDVSKNLMVIDDLADRSYDCDILLDQTHGRNHQSYQNLIPDYCKMLLGSKYSILRPEFARLREFSLKRRKNFQLKKLLITLGGSDVNNITGRVLESLKNCELREDTDITVVMGSSAIHTDTVKKKALDLPFNVEVKSDIKNMAELMANSDFAIGASGSTTWERSCLGLPTIQIELAKNQKMISQFMDKARAAICIDVNQINQMNMHIIKLKKNINNLIKRSSKLTDGSGVNEVLRFIK
jgi:UDP-2,4-diacetamido-2,4,6-trideoxy-beta-L-altropyranose hydrolase